MTEALIFDMDGVLVDSEPFHTRIEKQQFALNGISISEEEHLNYMGTASELMWREIHEKYRTTLTAEDLLEQNRIESVRFFTELEDLPAMDGLLEILEKLSVKNYPMAVASSSFPEIIEIVLTKAGIKKYFKAIVSGEEAGKSKPAPDIFLLAAKKLGIAPEKCLVIEDSQNGIRAAKAAGMFCVAYQGGSADPEKQNEADAVIKNYEQLEMLL